MSESTTYGKWCAAHPLDEYARTEWPAEPTGKKLARLAKPVRIQWTAVYESRRYWAWHEAQGFGSEDQEAAVLAAASEAGRAEYVRLHSAAIRWYELN